VALLLAILIIVGINAMQPKEETLGDKVDAAVEQVQGAAEEAGAAATEAVEETKAAAEEAVEEVKDEADDATSGQ
jgi:hypothetical protein